MSNCGMCRKSREIIVSADDDRICAALMDDGKAVEFRMERGTDKNIVGNIYRGRVQNILPGISAAFIDIGEEKNAFLNLEELASQTLRIDGDDVTLPLKHGITAGSLRIGQELMVQAVKEPFGSKGARLSTNITLPGHSVIYLPFAQFLGVSRKISSAAERDRLKGILAEAGRCGTGAIARTAAEGCGRNVIEDELGALAAKMDAINAAYACSRAPKLIYRENSFVERIVRDMLKPDVSRIAVNRGRTFDELREAAAGISAELAERVEAYDDDRNPFVIFDVEKQITEALSSRVMLKSGAYIVIERTEALVSIDVNSGKNTGKAAPSRTIVETNCEAALEIARQIRLRNLSGIIVTDFIDMSDKADREKVVSVFRRAFADDDMRTVVYGMTQLGLVEAARKKSGKTLSEILETPCPCCGGIGRKMSADAAAMKLCGIIRRRRTGGDERLEVTAAPAVLEKLRGMRAFCGEGLVLTENGSLGNDGFEVKACGTK